MVSALLCKPWVAAAILAVLSILPSNAALAQMPPSPRLLEMIKRGEIEVPYYFKNIRRIKEAEYALIHRAPAVNKRGITTAGTRMEWGPKAPVTGKWNTLVLLVDFPDRPGKVRPSFFDSLVFGNRFGTFKDYYRSLSFNALTIVPVDPPSSIGWVTVPHPYSYYINQDHGLSTNYPHNVEGLVEDVVHAVDSRIDFSKYDNDHDGYVDGLFLVHAGSGAEYTGNNDDFWASEVGPHTPQVLDGVTVSRCALVPEYYDSPEDMSVGVFAHEFGHTGFNLPDLYDIDYTSHGVGQWSLMADGPWNGPTPGSVPALPDAWSRIQMGYLTPITVGQDMVAAKIPAASGDSIVYKLQKQGNPGGEYFLVENRQKSGYDSYLPGNGLLIYHVDDMVITGNFHEWFPGNEGTGHYLVALEQADGAWELERKVNQGNAGDPFPGASNNQSFSALTTPSSNDYTGAATGIAVTNISNSAAVMTADLSVSQTNPVITVITPNGGERWPQGSPEDITWSASFVNDVKIELSTDGGSTWTTIAASVPAASGRFAWMTPGPLSKQAKVRVSDAANPSIFDVSDAVFALNASRTLVEEEPNNDGYQAQYLAYGDSVDASIDPVGDLDFYWFSATAGDTVEIAAFARGNSTLNGMLWLYNDSWTVVANNDDLGSWALSRLVYIAPKSGWYVIRFSANDNWNVQGAMIQLPARSGVPAGTWVDRVSAGRAITQQSFRQESSQTPLPSWQGDRPGGRGLLSKATSANTGDYRIRVRRFVPSPPMIFSLMTYDTYSNATQFAASICPNGSAGVAFYYGTSTGFENTALLPGSPVNSYVNSYYEMSVWTALVRGLSPNATYHYRLYVVTDRDSALSADNLFVTPALPSGWAFQAYGTGYHLRSCSFVNALSGVIVGTNGKILRTDDGGRSWISQTSPTNRILYNVAMTDLNTATSVGESGTILRTTNGGINWLTQNSGTQSSLIGISFINADTGTVTGDAGIVLRTTDGGAHWLKQNSGIAGNLSAVFFTGPLRGTAVGDGGTILCTTDGGSQWVVKTSGTDKPLYNVAFADPTTGMAVGGAGVILKTTDGGESWNAQQSGTDQWLEGLSLIDANMAVATGGSGTIVRTSNGGKTWSAQSSGTYNNLLGVSFSDRQNGTVVGAYGVILRTVSPEAVQLTRSEYPKEYLLQQNYPNPFNPSTTIRYGFPQRSHVTLAVYNSLGQQVAILVNGEQEPGYHEVKLDGTNLASGVYFYRMQASSFVETRKLLLIK